MNKELKQIEFEHATSGTIGLEAMFSILNTLFPTEKVIQLLNRGRSIFGLENNPIEEGQLANLSLFTPDGAGKFSPVDILSLHKIAPLSVIIRRGKSMDVSMVIKLQYIDMQPTQLLDYRIRKPLKKR